MLTTSPSALGMDGRPYRRPATSSKNTYTGAYIPPAGQRRVHINLWLLNGSVPVSGVGDEMIISSFIFQPKQQDPDNNPAPGITANGSHSPITVQTTTICKTD